MGRNVTDKSKSNVLTLGLVAGLTAAVTLAAVTFSANQSLKEQVVSLQVQNAALSASVGDLDERITKLRSDVPLLLRTDGFQNAVVDIINEHDKAKYKAQAKAKQESMATSNIQPLTGGIPALVDHDYVYGDSSALITIFEYADIECPFCKRYHGTPQKVVNASKGGVNFVFRHLPLEFHGEIAKQEALALECAGEQGGVDAFYAMSDQLFTLTRANGKGPVNPLESFADLVGIDQGEFASCITSQRHLALVDDDIRSATKVEVASADPAKNGITGTPATVIVNHETQQAILVRGAVNDQVLLKVIDVLKG